MHLIAEHLTPAVRLPAGPVRPARRAPAPRPSPGSSARSTPGTAGSPSAAPPRCRWPPSIATPPTSTTSATSGGRSVSDLNDVRRDRPGMERVAHGADRAARAGAPRPRAWGRAGGALPLSRPPAAAAGLARRAAPDRALGQRPGPEPVPAPHRLDLAVDDPGGVLAQPRGRSRWTSPPRSAWSRGVWFRIRQGIRGLLVPDERGIAVVYMICEPASHYYQVMTRSTADARADRGADLMGRPGLTDGLAVGSPR